MKDLGHVGHVSSDQPTTNTTLHMERLSTHKMDYNFNTLLVGKLFKYSELCLITGGDDGTIRVYTTNSHLKLQNFQEISKLESKGGPVQCLHLHDVTKFKSIDLIVGDSKGTLTIFSNEQILNRRILSQGCITALATDEDSAGNLAIVVGDDEGTVTAVSPYGSLWKIRLQDPSKQMHKELGLSLSVRCMLSVRLQTSNGVPINYLLVADNCKNLFIQQNGMIVYRLQAVSTVTAMTAGYFMPTIPQLLSPQSFGSPRQQSNIFHRQSQVAVATEDGNIYILNNFQLHYYASVHLPITHLASFSNDVIPENTDFLMCAGHFNALMVFQHQELVKKVDTNEWIHTVACTDGDTGKHIVLGMLDSSVSTYSVEIQ